MTDTNTSLVNINQTHGKYDIYRYQDIQLQNTNKYTDRYDID